MDERLKNKAYLEAMKLKNSGLDEEGIYARLEKQGIPEDLARRAAKNVMIQKKVETQTVVKESYNVAIIKIAIGVGLAIISYLVFPNIVILPVGFIVTGIILAVSAKLKMR